jgi:hypothetical protein
VELGENFQRAERSYSEEKILLLRLMPLCFARVIALDAPY